MRAQRSCNAEVPAHAPGTGVELLDGAACSLSCARAPASGPAPVPPPPAVPRRRRPAPPTAAREGVSLSGDEEMN